MTDQKDPSAHNIADDTGRDTVRVLTIGALIVILIIFVFFVGYIVDPYSGNPTAKDLLKAAGPAGPHSSSGGGLYDSLSEIPFVRYVLDIPGLSPSVRACYTVRSPLSSSIIAGGFGVSLGITYLFGTFLYKKFRDLVAGERREFWSSVSQQLVKANPAELAEIIGGFTEYEKLILERRNIYWGLFLRASLALLVVSLISLLIASCKIESQAGLPIITGIIAFIIGQGGDVGQAIGRSVVVIASNTREESTSMSSKTPGTESEQK